MPKRWSIQVAVSLEEYENPADELVGGDPRPPGRRKELGREERRKNHDDRAAAEAAFNRIKARMKRLVESNGEDC